MLIVSRLTSLTSFKGGDCLLFVVEGLPLLLALLGDSCKLFGETQRAGVVGQAAGDRTSIRVGDSSSGGVEGAVGGGLGLLGVAKGRVRVGDVVGDGEGPNLFSNEYI